MEKQASPFPDDQRLAHGLAAACGWAEAEVAVLARAPNAESSTFASEAVDCRVGGRTLRVFCKYSAEAAAHLDGGHRRGVGFEAEVYRRVLRPLRLSSARFHGAYADSQGGGTWLVLEFLDHTVRASMATVSGGAVPGAAAWAGSFHAANESRVGEFFDLLQCYDAEYYCRWRDRAEACVAESGAEGTPPWFGAVCRSFERDAVPRLVGAPQTVVHGEYYPSNILVAGGAGPVYPVDWESAAVGPGEVDLAALTDRWPNDIAAECVAAYVRARWPEQGAGAPRDFLARLDAARLYLQFRWLGNRSTWASARKGKRRLNDLRQLAERLGLIP